ncbi:Bax inhibitor-1/YccA family protein [Poriferisphaera sp. WC338]|uniref:Bax inhibitor-1/YccA family protein n=1 Tax=Poriferisphaera sp. WC338 TaxID=3425129 RepID=UPI003D815F65
MFNSSNPVLSDNTFSSHGSSYERSSLMTINGALLKTAFLLGLVVVSAAYAWYKTTTAATPSTAYTLMMVGAIGGLIVGIITSFSPTISPFTSPIYALLEGLFLGALSCVIEGLHPGIAVQAVGCTFGVFTIMLILYSTRIIKVTNTFIMCVMAATGGLMLFYLIAFVSSFFFNYPFAVLSFENGGYISIGFSILVVGLAALNLAMDFHFIERGAQNGAPKHMEWYAAFALTVTIVWLYFEILRLLSKLKSD